MQNPVWKEENVVVQKLSLHKSNEHTNKNNDNDREVKKIEHDSSSTCAYQGVKNVLFSENLVGFVFLLPPF